MSDIVTRSFDAWSAKQLRGSLFEFRFEETGVKPPTISNDLAGLTADVDILIVFTQDFKVFSPTKPGWLAVTYEPVEPPVILGRAVIFVDSLKRENNDARALRHVIQHEIGHALGLEHSPLNWFDSDSPRPNPLPLQPIMTPILRLVREPLHPDDRAWGATVSENVSLPYAIISGRVVNAQHPAEGIDGVQVIAVDVESGGPVPASLAQLETVFASITPWGPTQKSPSAQGYFKIAVLPDRTYRLIVRSIPKGFAEEPASRVTINRNIVNGEYAKPIPVKGNVNLPPILASIQIR